jgi:hypothetical protein
LSDYQPGMGLLCLTSQVFRSGAIEMCVHGISHYLFLLCTYIIISLGTPLNGYH